MLDTSKIYTSNNCGDFKIISYKNRCHVEVEFILTGFVTITHSSQIRGGRVKDKLRPTVRGVGFLGDGEYITREAGEITKAYSVWRHMLERCYCPKYHKTRPTYIGVTVCREWHNFQNFANWFDDNHIEGFQIDKDIKQRGVKNKVYSPQTCSFVSLTDNSIEAHAKIYRMRDPDGVIHNVYNMAEFVRKNNLDHPCMSQVHSGKANHHKGWTKA